MADTLQLTLAKRITALLETVSWTGVIKPAGQGTSRTTGTILLAGSVFRGRMVFGADMPLPCLSILESPRPEGGFAAAENNIKRIEDWPLLIQGWTEDDPVHPTDPAYLLKGLVEECLARTAVTDRTGGPLYPSDYLLGAGTRVHNITIGPGVVRPPIEQVSAKAFFYLPITLSIAVDVSQPFSLTG